MKKTRKIVLLLMIIIGATSVSLAQSNETDSVFLDNTKRKYPVFHYGVASWYGGSFQGKKTASGELYDQEKLTAACNRLPLGTLIKVTNLRNNKSIIVKVTDRLHPKNKRLVDLSKRGARELGFINKGLTNVKVEVIIEEQRQENVNN